MMMSNTNNLRPIHCEIEHSDALSLPFDSDWALLINLKHKTKSTQNDINGNDLPITDNGKKSRRERPDNERKKLRKLLSKYFTKDQLLGFCIDHDEFIKLHETLSKQDVETEQVAQRIIMKAYQKGLLDQLQEWAKKENPNQYEVFFTT
jgi:hypothetical protein